MKAKTLNKRVNSYCKNIRDFQYTTYNFKLDHRLNIIKELEHVDIKYSGTSYNAQIQSTFTCSKLTIKAPERRQWRGSGVFIVNFEHISHLVLVFLLLTLNV